MNHPLRLLLGLAGALLFSSCYYDPYYGSTYSSYGGSYGSYGYAPSSLIIRTSSTRWGYDPYRRCYYDYHNRHYYNPVTYSYYRTPPRRYSNPVYPKGYHHGRGHSRLHAPRYDQRKVRGLPPRGHSGNHGRQHSSNHSGRQIGNSRTTNAPTYRTTGYRYPTGSQSTENRAAPGSRSTRTYNSATQPGSRYDARDRSNRGSGSMQKGSGSSSRGSFQRTSRPTTTASAPTPRPMPAARSAPATRPAPAARPTPTARPADSKQAYADSKRRGQGATRGRRN